MSKYAIDYRARVAELEQAAIRNDERHAEAMRSVRKRAEHAEHAALIMAERADEASDRVAELEHVIVGIRGIVENWSGGVHSDYGAMAAVEDHLTRAPRPSVSNTQDSSAPASPEGDVLTPNSGERGDTRIVATATAAQGPGSGDSGERPALDVCRGDVIDGVSVTEGTTHRGFVTDECTHKDGSWWIETIDRDEKPANMRLVYPTRLLWSAGDLCRLMNPPQAQRASEVMVEHAKHCPVRKYPDARPPGWVGAPFPCSCGAGAPCPRCGTTESREVVDRASTCFDVYGCKRRQRQRTNEGLPSLADEVRSFLDWASFERLDMANNRNAKLYDWGIRLRGLADAQRSEPPKVSDEPGLLAKALRYVNQYWMAPDLWTEHDAEVIALVELLRPAACPETALTPEQQQKECCDAIATAADAQWNAAVEACAQLFDLHDTFQWLCLDHGGEEAEKIQKMIRALAVPTGGTP